MIIVLDLNIHLLSSPVALSTISIDPKRRVQRQKMIVSDKEKPSMIQRYKRKHQKNVIIPRLTKENRRKERTNEPRLPQVEDTQGVDMTVTLFCYLPISFAIINE
jgi:hypothetical protein